MRSFLLAFAAITFIAAATNGATAQSERVEASAVYSSPQDYIDKNIILANAVCADVPAKFICAVETETGELIIEGGSVGAFSPISILRKLSTDCVGIEKLTSQDCVFSISIQPVTWQGAGSAEASAISLVTREISFLP